MVSLVLTMAGRYYPTRPAKMMGKMTLSYGAAQIIGPAITGWLAAGKPAITHSGLAWPCSSGWPPASCIVGTQLLLFIRHLRWLPP
jgi:hypothetical protein